MSVIEVDRLEVLIEAEASKANKQLDSLISKLGSVSNALNGVNTNGLQNMANGINRLSTSMKSMNGVKTTDFNRLASNIQKLGKIDSASLYKTSNSLRNLTNTMNGVGSLSNSAIQLGEFTKNISKLGNVSVEKAVTNLPLLSSALKSFMSTLSSAPNVSQNIINMTNAMASLASQGSKYGSTINGMSRATKSLNKPIKSAINETNKFSRAQKSAKSSANSLTSQLSKLALVYFSLRRIVGFVGNSIEKSMDFTETVNLFQTSFKKIGMETASEMGMEWGSESADKFAKGFITKAQDFNDMLVGSLSLDPNTMMNYQAVFAQMTNSMGLLADTSMNISQSFTMLGNDIASLWNVDTDKAMKKLQSGLSGQIRPLRELGVDISQTSLEMTALNYGIKDNVKDMSQAAKIQLRWLSIMDQTEVAFGDMAKTIDSPANQLRILKQQWNNLSRSIGNVFMPLVSAVLPYINALVIALRRMIDTFATAVGFELPDYSDSNIYTESSGVSDLVGDYENLTDSTNDATKANEKLKKSMMGFDEINVLSDNRDSSKDKDSTTTGSGSGYPALDDAINSKTNSYMSKFNEELANMSNKAKDLADFIQPKLEGFVGFLDKISPALKGVAAAFVTYKVIGWFADFAKWIGVFSMSPAGIIAIAVGSLVLLGSALKELSDKAVEADLNKRFGEIELSLKDVEEIAKRLTDSKYSANIEIFITENTELTQIEKDIKTDLETINKLNWKVSVGIGLTSGESEEYKTAIDSFIKNSQSYIDQKQYVVNLALSATITDDASFLNEMQTMANKYFDSSRVEMETLGKKLREVTDKALADGILDADEQKVITSLQKEMTEITQKAADAEFKAKMKKLSLDYGDTTLTSDSWEDLTKKVQDINQERIDSLEEAELTVYETIYASYDVKLDEAKTKEEKDRITKEMEAEIQDYAEEVSKTKATITLEGMEFSLNMLTDNYQDALDAISPAISTKTSELFSRDALEEIKKMDSFEAMSTLTNGFYENYQKALNESGLSDASKKGLKEMLDGLEPTTVQLEKIYSDAVKAGKGVPDGVDDALTDINSLKALTGDLDAIAYLMGQKLSTDPIYLDSLAKSKTAGKDLNESLIAGLKSKIPDLKKQGNQLVFDLDDAVGSATKDKKVNQMSAHGQKMIKDLKTSFDDDTTTVGAVKTWLSGISTTVSNYKLPTLTFNAKVDTDNILGNLKGVNGTTIASNPASWKIPGLATGGQPNFGEMFVARENGIPELVGRIGNRTTVANNDQIVESVANGVYNALAPLLSGFNGGGKGQVIENVLNLDGDVIYRSYNQTKTKHDRRFE